MKFLKWGLFFLFSFVISWILIITFSQEAFKTAVPTRLLFYNTQPIAIYWYVTAAFSLGLLLGLSVAAYYFISYSFKLMRLKKEFNRQQSDSEPSPAQSDDAPPLFRPGEQLTTGPEAPAATEEPAGHSVPPSTD